MKKDIKVIMIICVIAILAVAILFSCRIIINNTSKVDNNETTSKAKLSKKEQINLKDKMQDKTEDFVYKCADESKIDCDDYLSLIEEIKDLGLDPTITFELEILNDNVGKKTSFTSSDVKGENVYDTIEDETVKETLNKGKDYKLKEGDILNCSITTEYENITGYFAVMVQSTGTDNVDIGENDD